MLQNPKMDENHSDHETPRAGCCQTLDDSYFCFSLIILNYKAKFCYKKSKEKCPFSKMSLRAIKCVQHCTAKSFSMFLLSG